MGFCNIRRSVVCMFLMIVLSNARHLLIPNSSSAVSVDTDCPVERLESRLSSIEDQLNRIQRINNPFIKALSTSLLTSDASIHWGCPKILSEGPSLIIFKRPGTKVIVQRFTHQGQRGSLWSISSFEKENCTVDLASYGLEDSPRCGYVRTTGGSSEEVLTPEKIDRNRGVTLFELDPTTCTTTNRQRFDTYASAYDRVQVLEALESAKVGTIIIGVTADTAESSTAFQNSAGSFFTRYNMNITGLQLREKFSFIMEKGYPKKTVFQRKARYGECLRMKVALRGNTVSDVTFSRV